MVVIHKYITIHKCIKTKHWTSWICTMFVIYQLYLNTAWKKNSTVTSFLMGQLSAEKSSLESNKSIEEWNDHRKRRKTLTRLKSSPLLFSQLSYSFLALFYSPDRTLILVKTNSPLCLFTKRQNTDGESNYAELFQLWNHDYKPQVGCRPLQQTGCISKIHSLSEHFFISASLS